MFWQCVGGRMIHVPAVVCTRSPTSGMPSRYEATHGQDTDDALGKLKASQNQGMLMQTGNG